MPAVRGLTVAVGADYAFTLRICLARNMRHLTECVVVTSPQDDAVKAVVANVPGARVFETDAFTRPDIHGNRPRFNKGLAIHEAIEYMGRDGWFWIWDSDCLFPPVVPLDHVQSGYLWGSHRRILQDPTRYRPTLDWRNCPLHRDGGPVGFTQIFDARDPAIVGQRIWYDVSFPHAGGGDAYFMRLWPRSRWRILPMNLLHLGPVDVNWMGTDEQGRAIMSKFVRQNGWRRALHQHSEEAAMKAAEIPPRLEYEGFGKSAFELPFVERANGITPERH